MMKSDKFSIPVNGIQGYMAGFGSIWNIMDVIYCSVD